MYLHKIIARLHELQKLLGHLDPMATNASLCRAHTWLDKVVDSAMEDLDSEFLDEELDAQIEEAYTCLRFWARRMVAAYDWAALTN